MAERAAILTAGLRELRLELSAEQIGALLHFVELMAKWNKTYNLTAIRDPDAMVAYHILDSLSVLGHVRGPRVLDVGAGAGLPGLPLAVCMPDCAFTLLDSNAKKTRFMRQAALELGLRNVTVAQERVQAFQPEALFSCIISRAFAAIGDMLALTGHCLADGGVWLAMKGKRPDAELEHLNLEYSVAYLHAPGVVGERCVVALEKRNHG